VQTQRESSFRGSHLAQVESQMTSKGKESDDHQKMEPYQMAETVPVTMDVANQSDWSIAMVLACDAEGEDVAVAPTYVKDTPREGGGITSRGRKDI
jgi:hypothetical protein